MKCICCGYNTKVVEVAHDEDFTFRKRRCPFCGIAMFTYEDLVPYNMDERMKKAFTYKRKH